MNFNQPDQVRDKDATRGFKLWAKTLWRLNQNTMHKHGEYESNAFLNHFRNCLSQAERYGSRPRDSTYGTLSAEGPFPRISHRKVCAILRWWTIMLETVAGARTLKETTRARWLSRCSLSALRKLRVTPKEDDLRTIRSRMATKNLTLTAARRWRRAKFI